MELTRKALKFIADLGAHPKTDVTRAGPKRWRSCTWLLASSRGSRGTGWSDVACGETR